MATKNVTEPARNLSHGRGGAGNISRERESGTKPEDLVTPTLKADHYTTGRGGTGNIAKNDPSKPEIARAAQDVEGPPPREPEGAFHYGRGGAANVVVSPTTEQANKTLKDFGRRRSVDVEGKEEEPRGLGEKGKELLGRIVGKK